MKNKKAGQLSSAFHVFCFPLGGSVQLASKGGLLSGSCILMQNTLSGGLVDFLNRSAHGLGFIGSAGVNRQISLFKAEL